MGGLGRSRKALLLALAIGFLGCADAASPGLHPPGGGAGSGGPDSGVGGGAGSGGNGGGSDDMAVPGMGNGSDAGIDFGMPAHC